MAHKVRLNPVLPSAIRTLAVALVNRTPDKSVGYSEASDGISDTWDQFLAAGAVPGDLERICEFVRWAKWEGFCETSPL